MGAGFDGGHEPTLREAREYVLAGVEEGVKCPCCGGRVKAYKRRLNRAKVRELQQIYVRIDETDGETYDYTHVPSLGISLVNREYPKLRWWGLLEPRDLGASADDGTAGWWRLTPAGVKFLRGELRVPNMVVEYRSQFLRFADDAVAVDVRAALADTSIDPDETDVV